MSNYCDELTNIKDKLTTSKAPIFAAAAATIGVVAGGDWYGRDNGMWEDGTVRDWNTQDTLKPGSMGWHSKKDKAIWYNDESYANLDASAKENMVREEVPYPYKTPTYIGEMAPIIAYPPPTIRTISIQQTPDKPGPIDTTDENGNPSYIGADENEAIILDSLYQSLLRHEDTFPPYVEGKQQCIQDAKLAIQNWKNDLAASGGDVSWADEAQLLSANSEWHAMVVLSPTRQLSFANKGHVFDPRYAEYRGTIRNYSNENEGNVNIYDIKRVRTMEGTAKDDIEGIQTINGNPLTTIYDEKSLRQIGDFSPNSESELAPTKTTRSKTLNDYFTAQPIQGKYYQSKNDPTITYDETVFNLLDMEETEKQNFELYNKNGTKYIPPITENKQYTKLHEMAQNILQGKTYLPLTNLPTMEIGGQ